MQANSGTDKLICFYFWIGLHFEVGFILEQAPSKLEAKHKVKQKNQILTHFRPMCHLRIIQAVTFYWQNVTLLQVFFQHFASKNQQPGFYISGTLVENGLIGM